MDFGKQYLDVYTTWVDRQVKIGQDLFNAVQGVDKFDPSLMWDKTLDAYQASIQGTLDAEVASTRLWFADLAEVKGLPEEAVKFVDYSKKVAEQVENAQQSMVDSGFEYLRKVDVKGFAVEIPLAQPAKKPAKAKA